VLINTHNYVKIKQNIERRLNKMAQTATERKKNRDFYKKETIRYYKLSKKFTGNNKTIQERRAFSSYDQYTQNGGTKTFNELTK